jgi:hypothetical protein
MVRQNGNQNSISYFEEEFKILHEQEFGFNFTARQILIDNIRVRSVGFTQTITQKLIKGK